jgi:hypothetical protein
LWNAKRRATRPGTFGSPAISSAIWLVLIGVCVLGAGCHNVATTWSAEARSPDGLWLATAQSQQVGGPGTAYDGTSVYLTRINGSQPPTQVLGFSHQFATMNLKMEWVTPTHLEVSYGASARPGDHVNLGFEVVKYGGIDISVRDLSTEKTDTSH